MQVFVNNNHRLSGELQHLRRLNQSAVSQVDSLGYSRRRELAARIGLNDLLNSFTRCK
jgi:hypothetical protein